MLTSDFSDLLSVFETFEIKYLVVGGYAVMAYTEPRFTKDLDILIDSTDENARKVYTALARFGAPIDSCIIEDFTTPGTVVQDRRVAGAD